MVRFRGRAAVGLSALVVALVAALVPASPLAATPRPDLAGVRAQVKQLREQAEAATEKYDGLREELASLEVQLTAARARLAAQRSALDAARTALGRVAADQYKAGDLATVALFLSDDPDGYLDANGVLVSVADRRTQAVADLQDRRRLLVAAVTAVDAQEQRVRSAQQALGAQRDEIERKLKAADDLLARLDPAERARLQAADDADDRAGIVAAGVEVPASGRLTCSDVPTGAVDARVAKVLAFACAQLGDPYRWGAAGPDRYDCSGLVLSAWKQAGVVLPHNAAAQAGYGTRVTTSQLRPGDVVFFYSPIGHDGIYLGSGLMLHAPRTGDVVKIAAVNSVGPVVAAVRL